jgi:hypothetical protein
MSEVFVLWDADIHDSGRGFQYNRFCTVGMPTILSAIATGYSEEVRKLRIPPEKEVVLAARHSRLAAALQRRRDLAIQKFT